MILNPTLDDVALRAGVSASTVSRFFNTPDVVASETAKRIRAAIAETGYIPNQLAGSLAKQKSKLVAVLIPFLNNSVFSDTIEAMVAELSASGSVVMLGLTQMDEQRTNELIFDALGRRADAIILTADVGPEMRQTLLRAKTNVIEIWDLPEHPIDIAVGFSHAAVGADLAKFLKTRGYCRPHVITSNTARARQRRDGLLKTWSELGGDDPSEDLIDVPICFGHARGAFARIRRLDVLPDVVICGSDHLAQGMIIEAAAAGLKVPDQMAVIGFGNSSLAGEMRPTITSVEVDGARIAREAIALLRRRSEGEDLRGESVNVGFRLVARESA